MTPTFTYFVVLSCAISAFARGPYCGSGPSPDVSHCQAAIRKINTGADYPMGTEFNAADCRIKVNKPLAIDGSRTPGATLASVANAVLSQCNGIGWGFDDQQGGFYNANISVTMCEVCMYGVCARCSAPEAKRLRQRREAEGFEADGIETDTTGAEPEDLLFGRSPKNFNHLQTRETGCQDTPGMEWTYCCPGAATGTDDCNDIADKIRGQTLQLPYVTGSGDCNLAIVSYKSNNAISGTAIADRMKQAGSICQSSGVIGSIHDYYVGPLHEPYYDFFFGNMCGLFDIGNAGCVP